MLANYVRGISAVIVTAGLLWLSGTAMSRAADKDGAAAPEAKADGKKAEKKKADPRGPLPAHYKDLIDGEQRTKIYAIQLEHEAEIGKLQAALKAAIAKRDAEVAAVLTPAQQEKLAKLQAEDVGKKGKRKGDMEGKDEKTASASPEAAANPKTPAAEEKK